MDNNYWIFKTLDSKDKRGQLNKEINNLITFYTNNEYSESNADLISNNIWLGNYIAAHDFDFITNNKINYIINACDDIPNKFPFINYINYPIKDINACYHDLLQIFVDGANTIHNIVDNNQSVLIHCKRGHHRSACILAFYFMSYHHMSLPRAIYIIKQIRPSSFRRMTCMLQTLINYELQRSDLSHMANST